MRGVRGFGNAVAAALLSIGLTLGALSISLVGFIPDESLAPTLTPISSPVPVTATNTFPPTSTLPAAAETLTFTATNTIVPSTNCPPPPGWIFITVQAGDTLDNLALRYGTNRDILKSRNCLISDSLIPGTGLYVPNQPTSTTMACIPGAAGWVRNYVVRYGDTFFNIASRYSTTAGEMKRVNCHPSDDIKPGDILWVPSIAPRTSTATIISIFPVTITPTLTEPVTFTFLPFTATASATQTPVPATSTPTATVTPIPTQTATLTPFPPSTTNP